jgi:hypothetical protein
MYLPLKRPSQEADISQLSLVKHILAACNPTVPTNTCRRVSIFGSSVNLAESDFAERFPQQR